MYLLLPNIGYKMLEYVMMAININVIDFISKNLHMEIRSIATTPIGIKDGELCNYN